MYIMWTEISLIFKAFQNKSFCKILLNLQKTSPYGLIRCMENADSIHIFLWAWYFLLVVRTRKKKARNYLRWTEIRHTDHPLFIQNIFILSLFVLSILALIILL